MTGVITIMWFVTAAIVWEFSPVIAMLILGWMFVDFVCEDYIAMKKKTWKRV